MALNKTIIKNAILADKDAIKAIVDTGADATQVKDIAADRLADTIIDAITSATITIVAQDAELRPISFISIVIS